jgi:Uncharacterised nucleotidyltransferase
MGDVRQVSASLSTSKAPDAALGGGHATPLLNRELSPEARLLLCCARTRVGPELVAEIRTLAALPLDWEFLCGTADKHRLTQLLFRNLSAICPESIPANITTRLRHQFHANAGSNLGLGRALIGLVHTFRAEGIPVIAFKGSVLANCSYGKLALRQYYDVDLFIHQQDVEQSDRVLLRQGYRCDAVFDQEARYKHADGTVEVDVHWRFTPRYFHLTFSTDELFARARPEGVLGQPVMTFCAEDLLEILCVQLMKDCWERRQQLEHLSKVCDIAEHLRAHPDLEWSRVLRSTQEKGLQRIVDCALFLARELLGAELPFEVANRIEADRPARRCARRMCRSLFTKTDSLSPLANPYLSVGLRFRQLAFYLGIRERQRDRVRHLGEIFKLYGSSQRTAPISSGNPRFLSEDARHGA